MRVDVKCADGSDSDVGCCCCTMLFGIIYLHADVVSTSFFLTESNVPLSTWDCQSLCMEEVLVVQVHSVSGHNVSSRLDVPI